MHMCPLFYRERRVVVFVLLTVSLSKQGIELGRIVVTILDSYSYVANCKPAALDLPEILRFELFNYIF